MYLPCGYALQMRDKGADPWGTFAATSTAMSDLGRRSWFVSWLIRDRLRLIPLHVPFYFTLSVCVSFWLVFCLHLGNCIVTIFGVDAPFYMPIV